MGWRPFAASRRRHAAGVQDVGDFAQAPPLGSQRLDRGQNVGGEPGGGGGLHTLCALAPHLVKGADCRAARPWPWLAPTPLWCGLRSSPVPSGQPTAFGSRRKYASREVAPKGTRLAALSDSPVPTRWVFRTRDPWNCAQHRQRDDEQHHNNYPFDRTVVLIRIESANRFDPIWPKRG